jgi:hypothetical protein
MGGIENFYFGAGRGGLRSPWVVGGGWWLVVLFF